MYYNEVDLLYNVLHTANEPLSWMAFNQNNPYILQLDVWGG